VASAYLLRRAVDEHVPSWMALLQKRARQGAGQALPFRRVLRSTPATAQDRPRQVAQFLLAGKSVNPRKRAKRGSMYSSRPACAREHRAG